MLRAFDGIPVLDSRGKRVGKVEQGYADARGTLRFVSVRLARTFGGYRLVPLEHVEVTEQGICVPYTGRTIRRSPQASAGDRALTPIRIDQLATYYAGHLDRQAASRVDVDTRALLLEPSPNGKAAPANLQGRLKSAAKTLFQKVMDDNIGMLAAMISWSILTSIVPIVVGLLALSGLFLHDPGVQANVVKHLSAALQGVFTPKELQNIVSVTTRNTGLLGIIGLLGVIWGGSNVGGAFSTAFQMIFETRGRPFIVEKLIDIGMIVVFTALMIVIVFTTSATALLNRLVGDLPVPQFSQLVLDVAIALLAAYLLFATIYAVFPNIDSRSKVGNIWPGALLAAVLFEALTFIWPIYVTVAHFDRYGALLFALLVLTAWIYFFAIILVIGAEVMAFRVGRCA
jgi:membrane protein